ncbi:MAG: LysE family transporter [Pseudomonadota bacterium]
MLIMDVVAYFAVLASLTLAPGPLSAILVAKTLAGDRSGALIFGSGIALGDTLIIILVCSGMGTWLTNTPLVFTLVFAGHI